MTKTSEEPKLILRRKLKRIFFRRHNILNEHNYSLDMKKCSTLKNSIELTDLRKNNYIDQFNSLPDWLKDHDLSSEEEGDDENKSIGQLLILEFQKDSKNSYKVCPPFDWVHLIYLTVKNFSKEYVSCYDVHSFSRHWFPYYLNKSWINSIISTLNCPSNKYFNYLSLALEENSVKWTVNIESVNILEESLMSIAKKHENQIKSAMKYPDKLPTILKGYGVHYLGYKRLTKYYIVSNKRVHQ